MVSDESVRTILNPARVDEGARGTKVAFAYEVLVERVRAALADAPRWVSKGALASAIQRAISARAIRKANEARAEGREEVARLFELFANDAIGQIPIESEEEGSGMLSKPETEVIEAAKEWEAKRFSDGRKDAERHLVRAVRAMRESLS